MQPKREKSLTPKRHIGQLPFLGSLLLRPGDSSPPPGEALSIGFRVLVSRHPAIQATGLS